MTRAYGTKPLIIKGAYVLAFALGVAFFYANPDVETDPWRPAKALIPLAILSLILVNAQGVTALTSERDTGALDLLLVTELSPKRVHLRQALRRALQHQGDGRPAGPADGLVRDHRGDLASRSAVYAIIDFLLLCPLLGDARPARGDHLHQQPDGGGQQPGDDLLPDGRHPASAPS